jgi:hypothetical protein
MEDLLHKGHSNIDLAAMIPDVDSEDSDDDCRSTITSSTIA